MRQGKVLALRAAYGPTTQVQLVGTKRHAATATIDTGPAAKYGEKKICKIAELYRDDDDDDDDDDDHENIMTICCCADCRL